METNEFFKENVIWERLNYNKYDRLGAGLDEFEEPGEDEAVYVEPSIPKSMSQQSLQSTGSSNKSFVTATSALSPVPPNSSSMFIWKHSNMQIPLMLVYCKLI